MARQVTTNAPGNSKARATPGPQPAPTQRPPGYEKDFTYGRSGYGANAYGGASSDLPGTRTRASLSVNNDDADPVLATIRQHGTAAMVADPTGDNVESVRGTPATQIRKIAAGNVPTHPAMRDPNNPAEKVPDKTGG